MFFIPEDVGELKDKVVLVVWGPGTSGDDLKRFSEDLSSQQCSVVIVENAERLSMCKCVVFRFCSNPLF